MPFGPHALGIVTGIASIGVGWAFILEKSAVCRACSAGRRGLELGPIVEICLRRSCMVGRDGLEPSTSAVERPERCADDSVTFKKAERVGGCYQDGGPTQAMSTVAGDRWRHARSLLTQPGLH